jgi:Zn-dependent protease with chaperone function
MEINLYLLIILIEWVMLVTVSAPMFFAGRFSKTPNLGIWLWFTSLLSAVLATSVSIVIAAVSIFTTWQNLSAGQNLGKTLLASFAPWVLLGVAGILMAVANQRLAPLFAIRGELDPLADLMAREITAYRKARIMELDIPGYFALTRDKQIYLSKAVFELPAKQLAAIMRHEYGHIKLRHQNLKQFAYLIYQLFPWMAASRALVYEVDRLCELSADKYALYRVYSKDLIEARSRFT